MSEKDWDISTVGLTEGVKTKTNYNLVGLIFGGLVAALFPVCFWLMFPLREILATLLVIAIIVFAFCVPRMMKQMPPSEQFKVRMAELGFIEVNGKLIPLEELHPTSAQNPRQLQPALPKVEKDGTKG